MMLQSNGGVFTGVNTKKAVFTEYKTVLEMNDGLSD